MSAPNITYTSTFVADGEKNPMTIKNFMETRLISSTENPDHIYRTSFGDFFLRYWDELAVTRMYYAPPETTYYKPKLLSYMLYNTTELWLALLRVNGMTNATEFHLPIIWVYEPRKVKQLIDIFFKRDKIGK